MGNLFTCQRWDGPEGKVVLPDGSVHLFDSPIPVAELMLDHPFYFIVELPPPSTTAAKLTALPADDRLDPAKAYMMLRMASGKSTPSSVCEARRILSAGKEERMPKLSMEDAEVRPEFLSRQFSSKGWKPSLGTIEERGLERKMSHWLF